MSIYGNNFIFDGKSSQEYSLRFLTRNATLPSTNLEGEYEYTKIKNPRGYAYRVVDRAISAPLSFDAEIIAEEALTSAQQEHICSWLFHRLGYLPLKIDSREYSNIYFNCLLLSPKPIYVGSDCIGYEFNVECDAPWGWSCNYSDVYRNLNKPGGKNSFTFYNKSDDRDYLVPIQTEICLGDAGGDVSIVNVTDDSTTMTLGNTSPNQVIFIDDNGQITASIGKIDYEKYNGEVVSFLPGKNVFTVEGDVSELKFYYRLARRVAL